MNSADNHQSGPNSRHLLDPGAYRKDGRKRRGFGRFLHRHGPSIGRTLVQVGRGVLDGVPGVSQVVNTLVPRLPSSPAAAGTRILVGWSTVALVAFAMLMKASGQIDAYTMLKLILAFLGI